MNRFNARAGVPAWRGRYCAALHACGAWLLLTCGAALAQPAGWSYAYPVSATEHSGAALTDYQLRMTVDTASMIAAGYLNADGSDLRFASDLQGSTLLPYYIESGINTNATVVWVKLGALPASGTIGFWMFSGNPAALGASTVTVFNYSNPGSNSATNQVGGANTGGVGNSQRGFRFSVSEDILLTQFGKNEPSGTTRYVTLFDFATQAIIAQGQVSGPAAQYDYAPLAQPVWLVPGQQYLIEMYQDTADGYYFGAPPQTSAPVTYYDMRYCNGFTQNTFPTNSLGGMHYGYVDFEFRTRQHVSPEPTFAIGPAPTSTATNSDNASVAYQTPVTFTATVSGVFGAATGSVSFYDTDGMTPLCAAPSALSATDPATATCVTSTLSTGTHQVSARYSGDALNAVSVSGLYAQEVVRASTASTMSTVCSQTFVGGQPFTMTATVAGVDPTGDVSFMFDMSGTPLCSNVTLVGGSATCTTSALDTTGGDAQDPHVLYAIYSGDGNYLPSSNSTTLAVVALNSGDVVFRSGFEDIPAGCPLQ